MNAPADRFADLCATIDRTFGENTPEHYEAYAYLFETLARRHRTTAERLRELRKKTDSPGAAP